MKKIAAITLLFWTAAVVQAAGTPEYTPDITPSETHTATMMPTHTATQEAQESATNSATETPAMTETHSATPTQTHELFFTVTATTTYTPTPAETATETHTGTQTDTFTKTPTVTATFTITATATASRTMTPTITVTLTHIPVPTATIIGSYFTRYQASFYPNPARSKEPIYMLYGSGCVSAEVSIYTVDGRKVFEQKYPLAAAPGRLEISTGALAPGIYIYRVVIEGASAGTHRTEFKKIIIRP